jgi:hypothetical protein
MTDRLRAALLDAERLPPADRERLADLIEETMAAWANPAPFTAQEMAHLRELDAEPFTPADPGAVAAFFAAHGRR